MYPESELNLNGNNVREAITRQFPQGDDIITARCGSWFRNNVDRNNFVTLVCEGKILSLISFSIK
jgi:hypothetical protein